MNDILDIDVNEIIESQEEGGTSSELLDALEVLSEKAAESAVDGKPIRIEKRNIGISSRRIDNVDKDAWIFSKDTKSKLSVTISDSSSSSTEKDYVAFIKLPRRILRSKDPIVSFTYRNNALFLRSEEASLTSSGLKKKSRVSSVILSASIGNRTISNLKNPILLEFEKKDNKTAIEKASCVFWKRGKNISSTHPKKSVKQVRWSVTHKRNS